jgi:ribosomal protein S28E/S33
MATVYWKKGIVFDKDPDETIYYALDFSGLMSTGVAVTAVGVTADNGLTASHQSTSGQVISILCSGGTAGISYTVEVNVTGDDGQIFSRSIDIRVSDL